MGGRPRADVVVDGVLRPARPSRFSNTAPVPLVLLASSGYVGYLRRGAAERLGLNSICNDGVAAMAARMVAIIETLKPSMLIIRRDLAVPFAMALEASGAPLAAACDGSRLAKSKAQFRAEKPPNYPRASAFRSGASYVPMRLS